MRNFILIAIIVFLSNSAFVLAQKTAAVSDVKSDSSAETQAVRKWLASRAIPLKSVQAETGFSDLKPLKSVFKDVRIVALGESSHGQREFFQFKHRMLEFLVTQMGFKAFSLEASYPACMNINEYVVYGRGDSHKVLASQGFAVFDTQEFFDLIVWMRKYNSKLPEAKRIRFLGFDMQGQYQYAMDAVSAYLKKVSPDQLTEAEAAFVPLKAEGGKGMPISTQTADEQAKSVARLEKLHSFLAANRGKFVRQTSQWDFDVVLLHARVLVQGANYAVASSVGVRKFNADKDKKNKTVYSFVGDAIALRDVYMAENVATELKMLGPNARMVISGHNGHIGLAPWGDGLPGFEIFKIQAMGNHLRKKFGDEYYALGFDFYSGSFQANERNEKGKFEMREFQTPPASEGTAAWYLKTAVEGKGFQNYVINLRDAPKTGLVTEWLSRPLGMTVLGGGFSKDRTREEAQAHIPLKDYYDGLLFVGETTRARPNADGKGK